MRNQRNRAAALSETVRLLRPRTVYYAVVIVVVGSVMLYNLLTRSELELHVQHDRNPLFVTLSDGSIRNGYDIKILNKTYDDQTYRIRMNGLKGAEITVRGAGDINPDALPVFADSVGHYRLFVVAPKPDEARMEVWFQLEAHNSGLTDGYDSVFISGAP